MMALALVGGCNGGSSTNAPPISEGTSFTTTGPSSEGTGSATGSGSGSETAGTMDDTAGSETGVPNCDDIVCTGHGDCVMTPEGATCVCDDGYKLDEAMRECIVDEACIQVRHLESHCRQIYNGAPAVATFFAVDFCAGTAVLPAKFEELQLQFQVLENGVDIAENVESYSSIIEASVESYVAVALDVSDSLVVKPEFPALVDELRGMVSALAPGVGEADVYVSIYVFGRQVEEFVPFTRDFAALDGALASIATDPTPAQVVAGGGNGTDLYDAVELGIHRTQRIRELRDAVTWGGVLSTGTVVVVTDGNDTSNGMLDEGLIADTVNNVISIGVSDDIDAADLQAIGRDGSFLAPTPADWAQAFDEITVRVDQYPERSYLLAYCSSTTEGEPEVEVGVLGEGVMNPKTAACQFNADYFGTMGESCDQALFDNECIGVECGGLTACGACADTECCDGSLCQAPVSANQSGVACEAHDVCNEAGQVCDGGDPGMCVAPLGVGEICDPSNSLCEPTIAYCDDPMMMGVDPTCVAALPLGAACSEDEQCHSLNCSRENPDNPFEQETCRRAVLMYDTCGTDGGLCEEGSYCEGSVCSPKKLDSETCSTGPQCRHAECVDIGTANVCGGPAACYWSWDEKVPD
jgi:hypothetical protein